MSRCARVEAELEPRLIRSSSRPQIHYPGDDWNDENAHENLYGNLKALYLLKKKHRHLKS